jgi:hypothetical protein
MSVDVATTGDGIVEGCAWMGIGRARTEAEAASVAGCLMQGGSVVVWVLGGRLASGCGDDIGFGFAAFEGIVVDGFDLRFAEGTAGALLEPGEEAEVVEGGVVAGLSDGGFGEFLEADYADGLFLLWFGFRYSGD